MSAAAPPGAAPQVPAVIIHALNNLLGPWFIGIMISSVIFGVTCLQMYLYFSKFSAKDPVFLKVFVAFLLAIEVLHVVLLGVSYYTASITNFGNFVEIFLGPWSLRAQIVIGVFLGTMVQMFYAYRIYVLSHKSPWLSIVIILTSIAALVCTIIYTYKASLIEKFDNNAEVVPWSTSSLSLEVACDIMITIGMVTNLWNGRTEFSKTNRALHILITYTINTGALTMVFAALTLIFWLASKTTLIYALFFFILVRLYGCSFMSILNSRDYVRKQLNNHQMVTIPSNSTRTAHGSEAETKNIETYGTLAFATPSHPSGFNAV
ncbi:hypothetical protein B0H15DRAFT_299283 [Mycena belliarum]|uniref:DUF6534 domain-containing protein n=1 Tax=Mycena belliarum TaxID=1033014 RepID=A0AAD6XU63_9AGAR|nr:hypothetical protein B0H15DRAFT_299283 [Mycena belliae]